MGIDGVLPRRLFIADDNSLDLFYSFNGDFVPRWCDWREGLYATNKDGRRTAPLNYLSDLFDIGFSFFYHVRNLDEHFVA